MQGQVGAVFAVEDYPVLGDVDAMAGAPVVEARLQVQHEPHGAARYAQMADDAMAGSGIALDDRHEVHDLSDAIGGHEAGDKHCGVWEVKMPGHVTVAGWADAEISATVGVKQ